MHMGTLLILYSQVTGRILGLRFKRPTSELGVENAYIYHFSDILGGKLLIKPVLTNVTARAVLFKSLMSPSSMDVFRTLSNI